MKIQLKLQSISRSHRFIILRRTGVGFLEIPRIIEAVVPTNRVKILNFNYPPTKMKKKAMS